MREALRKWPIVTNGLLVGFVTGSGDILAQRLRNRHDSLAKHNWQRTALMGTWGVTIFGPMWAWWYRFLDARLHVYSAQSIAAKVAITATVMAPISNALFFTFMTAGERIMHKGTLAGIQPAAAECLQTKLIPTTVASAKVWVPANTVNWLVVPAHLRTVFSSLVGVAWNTYLSLTLHDSEDEEKPR